MGEGQGQDRAFKSMSEPPPPVCLTFHSFHCLPVIIQLSIELCMCESIDYTKPSLTSPKSPPMNVVLVARPSTCEQKRYFMFNSRHFFHSVFLISKDFIFLISQSWGDNIQSQSLKCHLITDQQFCTVHWVLGKGVFSRAYLVNSPEYSLQIAYIKSTQSRSIKWIHQSRVFVRGQYDEYEFFISILTIILKLCYYVKRKIINIIYNMIQFFLFYYKQMLL